jgi:hypothetical protein
MADDNDSVISRSNYDQLFKAPPVVKPLDLPGHEGTQLFRDIADGDSPGAMKGPPELNTQQLAIVNAVVDRIAKIARNTNFTAALPAYTAPGYWSNNIDESDTVLMAAAVTPYQTVLEYTAPPSRYGFVNAYGFDVQDPTYTYDGTLQWRMVLNGVPVQSLLDFGEHRGSMVQPAKTFIVVPMGQKLQFQIQRTLAAGGALSVAMKFKGWDWLLRKNAEGTKAGILAF